MALPPGPIAPAVRQKYSPVGHGSTGEGPVAAEIAAFTKAKYQDCLGSD